MRGSGPAARSALQHDAERSERQDEANRRAKAARVPDRIAGRDGEGEGVGRQGVKGAGQIIAGMRQCGPGGGQPAGRQVDRHIQPAEAVPGARRSQHIGELVGVQGTGVAARHVELRLGLVADRQDAVVRRKGDRERVRGGQ